MTRDQFLTEKMGECWHEYDHTQPYIDGGGYCRCGKLLWGKVTNHDFSTWEGFGKLVTNADKLKLQVVDIIFFTLQSLPFDDKFPDKFASEVYNMLTSKTKT